MFSALIEIGIILLFILNIFLAKKTKKLDLLLIATIFAAFFENLHVVIFQNYTGGYYYSSQFIFDIYKVPLFIVLSWGIIILNAYIIATKLTNKVARIFLTPLLVVTVDFALEFFAVKQGYWTWIGYESTQGLFGVPASNFISWMLITLALIFCYEQVREKWIVPLAAYILFVFMATGQIFVADMLGINTNEQVYIIWFVMGSLAIATLALRNIKEREDVKKENLSLAVLSRSTYYIFALMLALADLNFAKSIWPILAYAYLIETAIVMASYYKKRNKIISSFSSLIRNMNQS